MESWYLRNKEYAVAKQKEYKSTLEFKEKRREYDRKNHEHQLQLKQQWRKNNPKKYKIQKRKDDRKYYQKVKYTKKYQEHKSEYQKKYSKENPDKMLKNHINSLKKLGLTLNMNHFKIGMALKSWSQTIRKNNPFCWCGEKADVTHHIFEKQYYPKLMLNINNGIPLCNNHHNEVHGKRDRD